MTEPLTYQVRTLAEAYMYLELTLAGDTPRDYERLTRIHFVDDHQVLEFDGEYEGRQHRMFFVAQPLPPGEVFRGAGVFGYGSEPSPIIDPGGWRLIEEWYRPDVLAAERHLNGDAEPTPEEFWTISEGLANVTGAVEEIGKFIPPGADVVPREACFTESGRRVYDIDPDVFRRSRVEADLARYERVGTEFTRRWDPHPR